ncbi:MAG: transposase, partial [Proteobacteria bacterium]|nr:transposase [Pseudomonadota bacterium]
MKLPEVQTHQNGESSSALKEPDYLSADAKLAVDTFGGRVHVEWDPQSAVTPLGQLPFFIEFLKLGNFLDPWIEDCPLHLTSPNAPSKGDVLGTLLLSILAGHRRYAHVTTIRCDGVNPGLLGMSKIVSEDSLRRALLKIVEDEGATWLQKHLYKCYQPLLDIPWVLDVDTTIKVLYGKQEGAVVGYNPKKPGRPSHTYHTFSIAN